MSAEFEWSDLKSFLAVARTGGLSAAAAESGASPATLGRRMTALESALGQRLFLRGARGYALTDEGATLLKQAEAVERAATAIEDGAGEAPAPRVRITAGFWTARYLAAKMQDIWSVDAPWQPDLRVSSALLNLGRREVDIGIRNRRPTERWLAGRRVGHVDYAVYASSDTSSLPWIDLGAAGVTTPTARWVAAQPGAERLVTNDPAIALVWLAEGIGRAVLPIFAGDTVPGVARQSEAIEALRSEQWLISHHDHRHHPPVRAALEALAPALQDMEPT
ncbi:MAG: LysR family transcriptional regulator [Pseudomonadota bacterium]